MCSKNKFNTTTEINPEWSHYDKTTAKAHLMNYGKIYLDEYGCPIDDDCLVDEIRETD